MTDLLSGLETPVHAPELIAKGAMLLRGFAAAEATALLADIGRIAAISPFRHMTTPGGFQMSVAMTNCGKAGWITERSGYRYGGIDPQTRQPWPPMPPAFFAVATRAAATAGFSSFAPDACLINRYEPGARMSLHQDRDEQDFTQPIVSVSLGLPCRFLFGGAQRTDKAKRISLLSGDVVVWGGPARLVFHGVAPLADGTHPLAGRFRFNLTFRQAL
jgi:alkylated DNA repair protein (DNA oxidative demethylase)